LKFDGGGSSGPDRKEEALDAEPKNFAAAATKLRRAEGAHAVDGEVWDQEGEDGLVRVARAEGTARSWLWGV
jgi:hypothetical protein